MKIQDGVLRCRFQDHDYAFKKSGFGPDDEDGVERWCKENGSLQESVSECEYYYGRTYMLSSSPKPIDATCNCSSKSDCDPTTSGLPLSPKQANSNAHSTPGQL